MQKVRNLIGTDPMDLLPQHRSILHVDYEALGEGTSIDRQLWIAQIESALSARKRRREINNVGNSSKRQHSF